MDRRGGSPALAGIDPCPWRASATTVRLPRTRGDRPRGAISIQPRDRAPPHSRGSTLVHRRRPGDDRGSPALAGIDPNGQVAHNHQCRLPRTRGDRPERLASGDWTDGAPPHSRGSTRAAPGGDHPGPGSPALAGIDPCARSWCDPPGWLPRTRGDRPEARRASPSEILAPPPMRGSTLDLHQDQHAARGSPAHAGIMSASECVRCRTPLPASAPARRLPRGPERSMTAPGFARAPLSSRGCGAARGLLSRAPKSPSSRTKCCR